MNTFTNDHSRPNLNIREMINLSNDAQYLIYRIKTSHFNLVQRISVLFILLWWTWNRYSGSQLPVTQTQGI